MQSPAESERKAVREASKSNSDADTDSDSDSDSDARRRRHRNRRRHRSRKRHRRQRRRSPSSSSSSDSEPQRKRKSKRARSEAQTTSFMESEDPLPLPVALPPTRMEVEGLAPPAAAVPAVQAEAASSQPLATVGESKILSQLMQTAKTSDFDLMKARREARVAHAAKLKAQWEAKRQNHVAMVGEETKVPQEYAHLVEEDAKTSMLRAEEDKKDADAEALADRFGKELNEATRFRQKDFFAHLPETTFTTPAEFLPVPITEDDVDTDKDLNLFIEDVDYYSKKPGVLDAEHGANRVPVLRAYCSTDKSQSVLLHVHAFEPYLYARLPAAMVDPRWKIRPNGPEADCPERAALDNLTATLACEIEERVREAASAQEAASVSMFVANVEVVARESIMYYSFGQLAPFLKVTVTLPKVVTMVRSALIAGLRLPKNLTRCTPNGDPLVSSSSSKMPAAPGGPKSMDVSSDDDNDKASRPLTLFQVFDANVLFPLRFLIDTGCKGCSWVTLPAGKYKPRPAQFREGLHEVEIDVRYQDLLVRDTSIAPWNSIPPLRVVSFDIECKAQPNHFPDAKVDPCIMIAAVMRILGKPKAVQRILFCVGTCDPIEGVSHVASFATEKDMLIAWSQFTRECAPHVWTGYNINNFDIRYLLERATQLGIETFTYWGRVVEPLSLKSKLFNSRGTGAQRRIEVTVRGHTVLDMLGIIKADHKLGSYTLNAVASKFLKSTKDDIHHSQIAVLFAGSSADRARLGKYCVKDAELAVDLLMRLSKLVNLVEMCRVTGLTLLLLITRGQGLRTASLLMRRARQRHLVKPYTEDRRDSAEEQYEGATVITPKSGFYVPPHGLVQSDKDDGTTFATHGPCACQRRSAPAAAAAATGKDQRNEKHEAAQPSRKMCTTCGSKDGKPIENGSAIPVFDFNSLYPRYA